MLRASNLNGYKRNNSIMHTYVYNSPIHCYQVVTAQTSEVRKKTKEEAEEKLVD